MRHTHSACEQRWHLYVSDGQRGRGVIVCTTTGFYLLPLRQDIATHLYWFLHSCKIVNCNICVFFTVLWTMLNGKWGAKYLRCTSENLLRLWWSWVCCRGLLQKSVNHLLFCCEPFIRHKQKVVSITTGCLNESSCGTRCWDRFGNDRFCMRDKQTSSTSCYHWW